MVSRGTEAVVIVSAGVHHCTKRPHKLPLLLSTGALVIIICRANQSDLLAGVISRRIVLDRENKEINIGLMKYKFSSLKINYIDMDLVSGAAGHDEIFNNAI